MNTLTTSLAAKLGSKGRIVIPAAYRKALGLRAGDALVIKLSGGRITITPLSVSIVKAQQLVRKYVPVGRSLSEELIKGRREESARG